MLEHARKLIENAGPEITEINLSRLELSDENLVDLVEMLKVKPQITKLNLSANKLTSKSGKILSEILPLKHLDASFNPIGDEGATFLLNKPGIECLDLRGCGLTIKLTILLIDSHKKGVKIFTNDNPDLCLLMDDDTSVEDALTLYARSFKAPAGQSSGYSLSGLVNATTAFFGRGCSSLFSGTTSQSEVSSKNRLGTGTK